MDRKMSDSQRAYERKRAEKGRHEPGQMAGLQGAREKARRPPPKKPEPPKAPGLFGRLIDRAHKAIEVQIILIALREHAEAAHPPAPGS